MGRKPKIIIGGDCPNCSAVWGLGEMDEGKCFCCGYPENESEFDDNDDDDEFIVHEEDLE